MENLENKRALVVSFLESAEDILKLDQDSPLEDYFDVVERMSTKEIDSSDCIRDGVLTALNYFDIEIYRHPAIAEGVKQGVTAVLLALVEAGASILKDDKSAQVERAVRQKVSDMARRAADAKHNKPGGSRELAETIRKVWAGGHYRSKDACAEEEWRGLGFGSYKAARNALRNEAPARSVDRVPPTRRGDA